MAERSRRTLLADSAGELADLPHTIRAVEVPMVTQVAVRAAGSGPTADAVAAVLGVPLPVEPCRSARAGSYEVLWLGPDEWLVLAPPGAAPDLVSALRACSGDGHLAVTDVSAQRVAVSLSGPSAREVLAKGCSIDFHPRVTPAGTCVQTLLGQTGVVIVVRDDAVQDFLVLVRSSFSQYFADWLVAASVELTAELSEA